MKQIYTKQQYEKYVNEVSPKSSFIKNLILAFIVGGLICDLGQLITNYMKSVGYNQDIAGDITSISLVFLGAFLTGIGVYDYIGKYAGAGSIIPITGFANSIVAPAMEFKSEGLILGVGAKMFVIAGPVLVYGFITSTLVAIIYYLIGL